MEGSGEIEMERDGNFKASHIHRFYQNICLREHVVGTPPAALAGMGPDPYFLNYKRM